MSDTLQVICKNEFHTNLEIVKDSEPPGHTNTHAKS